MRIPKHARKELEAHLDCGLLSGLLSELAQQGISCRGYQPGPYSNREELLHGLDRFVLEKVGSSRSRALRSR